MIVSLGQKAIEWEYAKFFISHTYQTRVSLTSLEIFSRSELPSNIPLAELVFLGYGLMREIKASSTSACNSVPKGELTSIPKLVV